MESLLKLLGWVSVFVGNLNWIEGSDRQLAQAKWVSQARHDLVAQQETFASRIVVCRQIKTLPLK
jgi:hypothetical protein